jgi:plasmid stabilization system protein ParE
VKLRITKPAQKQLDYIETWWLANRDKAPERFEEELEHAKEFLRSTPLLAPVHVKRGEREIRWIVMPKTKVKLYFWVNKKAGFVRIVAAWGGQRGRPPKF